MKRKKKAMRSSSPSATPQHPSRTTATDLNEGNEPQATSLAAAREIPLSNDDVHQENENGLHLIGLKEENGKYDLSST